MSTQVITGQFPLRGGVGFVLRDDQTLTSRWSPGQQLIISLPVQPIFGKPWWVHGWSFTAEAEISNENALNPVFGKLGRLFTALITAPFTQSPAGASMPYQPPPATALPFIQTLWDGSADPVFAQFLAGQPTTTLNTVANVDPPIPVLNGEQLGMGIWLTPSLMQNTLIQVVTANWALVYDE